MWGYGGTSEVFKNKKYSVDIKMNVQEFAWDRGWKGINAPPTQNSNTFSVKFSVFNFISATVFNVKSPDLRYLLTFTPSLHF